MNKVHWGEGVHLSAHDKAKLALPQHLSHLARSLGRKANKFEEVEEKVDDKCADPCELHAEGLQRAEGWSEDGVPRLASRVVVVSRVARLDHLETNLDEGFVAMLGWHQVGKAITLLDETLGLDVHWVIRVVLLGQAPLVRDEHAAWLEHSVDLPVHISAIGGVAARFDRINMIKRVVREGQLVEIGLDKLAAGCKLCINAQLIAAIHLVLVEGDARD
mmetsp:Transcript_294/g.856  ORF Transcript_294/g.856 Transcript_294/m.856 type:complete len:218 (+) Transcript_294:487-1140(+)|eukprot:scaffold276412_cov30-Tisochrysis_lutea.AAC.1